MAATRELLRALHERIGVGEDPEVDEIVRVLAERSGDPTAGEDVNSLIHRLYAGLGGLPNEGHGDCPACAASSFADVPNPAHSHPHVHCTDGESTGEWVLECGTGAGRPFAAKGPTLEAALRVALKHRSLSKP